MAEQIVLGRLWRLRAPVLIVLCKKLGAAHRLRMFAFRILVKTERKGMEAGWRVAVASWLLAAPRPKIWRYFPKGSGDPLD